MQFFWTRSKNRVIGNRVMENRVKRGITVVFFHTGSPTKNKQTAAGN